MYIKEVLNYRDGGTIGFNLLLGVEDKEKLGNPSLDTIITIDCGMNGNGMWYNGLKGHGGTIIQDIEFKNKLIKTFEEHINRETIILENVKQFL